METQSRDPYSPEGHDPYEPEGEERPYDSAVDKFWEDEPNTAEEESEPAEPAGQDFPEDIKDWSDSEWERFMNEVLRGVDNNEASDPADYESGDYPDDPEGGDTTSQGEANQTDPNADVVEDMQQETEDWFNEETVESHQDQSEPTEPTDLWDKPSEEWTKDDWDRFSEYEKSARGRDVDPHEPLDADDGGRGSGEQTTESRDPVEEPTDLWEKPHEDWTDEDHERFGEWAEQEYGPPPHEREGYGEEREFSDPGEYDPDEGWREEPFDYNETGQPIESRDPHVDPYEDDNYEIPDFEEEDDPTDINADPPVDSSAERKKENTDIDTDDIPF